MHTPLLLLLTATLSAEIANPTPRLCGEVLVGTAGFELGVAAEWDLVAARPMRLRPELLHGDFPVPGIGGSFLFGIAPGELPNGQTLFIGPRAVFHNNRRNDPHDDQDKVRYGFEAGCAAFYGFPIVPTQPGKHRIDAIGVLGFVDHDSDFEPALTLGAAYGYQF